MDYNLNIMDYNWDRLKELPEDERVEEFALLLGQLTEEELGDLLFLCADIIEAVESRTK